VDVYPDTLVGIKLTTDGKKPQKQAIFITDLEEAKIIEHPVRMAIIAILNKGIMDNITTKFVDPTSNASTVTTTPTQRNILSVIEIVKVSKEHDDILTLTRNQVNHHLSKLVEKKFVHRYGTVTTGKRITHYYRRAAKQYVVTMETPYYNKKWLEQRESARLEQTLNAFDINLTKKEKSELAKLLTRSELLKDNWRSKIADLARGDVTEPNITDMYHWLIDAYAMGSQEYLDIHRRIREILFQE
jgi:DNA-binding transcriptional ArsR family regulator